MKCISIKRILMELPPMLPYMVSTSLFGKETTKEFPLAIISDLNEFSVVHLWYCDWNSSLEQCWGIQSLEMCLDNIIFPLGMAFMVLWLKQSIRTVLWHTITGNVYRSYHFSLEYGSNVPLLDEQTQQFHSNIASIKKKQSSPTPPTYMMH